MRRQAQTSGTPWKAIVRHAVIVAAVLGTLLTALNQWQGLRGTMEIEWPPVVLVYVTPFVVVTLSQILGARAAHRALHRGGAASGERFLTMLAGHGIPARAVLVGAVAASANTAIVATVNALAGRGLDQLELALVAQALFLPAVFGALSQTLSFRRTVRSAA